MSPFNPLVMADHPSERFLADRAAPVCSLDVAKSFEQLR